MTKDLQHGSRKRLEITLIMDGDSNRTRYHSPSPYVLSSPFALRFTIQVKQFYFYITFRPFETRQQPCTFQPLLSFQLQTPTTKQSSWNNQEKNPLLHYQFHHRVCLH